MKFKGIQLFQAGHNKALNELLVRIDMNMSNNYKDNAQDNFKDFCKLLNELDASGKIKGKQKEYYVKKREEYSAKLKDYTHKDQKPYWT